MTNPTYEKEIGYLHILGQRQLCLELRGFSGASLTIPHPMEVLMEIYSNPMNIGPQRKILSGNESWLREPLQTEVLDNNRERWDSW